MCTYCMIGDWQFRHDPPFDPQKYSPLIPVQHPLRPINPWPLADLKEFQDLLKRVKALEDALGCPCEPNKADYIGILEQRIAELEKRHADHPG